MREESGPRSDEMRRVACGCRYEEPGAARVARRGAEFTQVERRDSGDGERFMALKATRWPCVTGTDDEPRVTAGPRLRGC